MRIESLQRVSRTLPHQCFKDHTQKMRIESATPSSAFLYLNLFQRSYSENEDWKNPYNMQHPGFENVSKVILRKWGLKGSSCFFVISGKVSSFQRSYSENEDWKIPLHVSKISETWVSKVILRKWGLKETSPSMEINSPPSVSKVILRKWGLKGVSFCRIINRSSVSKVILRKWGLKEAGCIDQR